MGLFPRRFVAKSQSRVARPTRGGAQDRGGTYRTSCEPFAPLISLGERINTASIRRSGHARQWSGLSQQRICDYSKTVMRF